MPNGIQQYVKLEERLLLLAWLNGLFGYQRNRDLLADMKKATEGSPHLEPLRGDLCSLRSAIRLTHGT